jgi:hypothetical protein
VIERILVKRGLVGIGTTATSLFRPVPTLLAQVASHNSDDTEMGRRGLLWIICWQVVS